MYLHLPVLSSPLARDSRARRLYAARPLPPPQTSSALQSACLYHSLSARYMIYPLAQHVVERHVELECCASYAYARSTGRRQNGGRARRAGSCELAPSLAASSRPHLASYPAHERARPTQPTPRPRHRPFIRSGDLPCAEAPSVDGSSLRPVRPQQQQQQARHTATCPRPADELASHARLDQQAGRRIKVPVALRRRRRRGRRGREAAGHL